MLTIQLFCWCMLKPIVWNLFLYIYDHDETYQIELQKVNNKSPISYVSILIPAWMFAHFHSLIDPSPLSRIPRSEVRGLMDKVQGGMQARYGRIRCYFTWLRDLTAIRWQRLELLSTLDKGVSGEIRAI